MQRLAVLTANFPNFHSKIQSNILQHVPAILLDLQANNVILSLDNVLVQKTIGLYNATVA